MRTLCVIVLLIMPVLLRSQETTNLPWWTSPVVSDLGLSAEQNSQIRHIVRSYRNRLFDARNDSSKAEADLQDLLNEPTVDPAKAKPAVEKLAKARAETTRVFTSMSVEMRAVLTQEQWRQLVRRWSDVQRTRHRRGDTEVAP